MYVDIGRLHMTSIKNMIMQIMVNLPPRGPYNVFLKQIWSCLDYTELQAKDGEFSIRLP